MEDTIIVKEAFQVFEKIRKHGKQSQQGYELNGISAINSPDGYTVSLVNDYVNLTIFFHNKFSFEASNQKEKQAFIDKLNQIQKNFS